MRKIRRAALCAAALFMVGSGTAGASTPVSGFKEETLAVGFDQAIALDWTPDGRMVIVEKPGIVKVRNPNGVIQQVLDISRHVNSHTDRGLTGVAVDSDYASNNYVYLLYTYDADARDSPAPTQTRLSRIVLRPDNKVANAATAPETVIVGGYAVPGACPTGNQYNCVPADGVSHVGGTVLAAPDGTLYVGTGDAMFAATNSPNPLRPLDPASLAGKILHVDRNGKSVPGHPYCPTQTGTLACARSWAKGFRNPFRFSLASRGGIWAGDVGEALFEELNHVKPGGSFGWPCLEANVRNRALESTPGCQSAYSAGLELPPIWSYGHTSGGAAIIVGDEVASPKFPIDWQGGVLVGDIVGGQIDVLHFAADGTLTAKRPFASGWQGADLRFGPDGYLYSAEFYSLRRFVPIVGNRPPQARASVAPVAGLAPFNAQFDGTASSDPDGDALTYQWTFGDGMSSTEAAPSHTYVANGRYTAELTVTDTSGATSTAEAVVVVGTTPPSIEFTKPGAGFEYTDGVPVDVEVQVTDAQDGTIPDSSISGQVVLQHNQHQHFLSTFTGRTVTFTPLVTHDADSYYVVEVTATDSHGVSTTETLRLDPRTVRLELTTDPPLPAELFYDGAPHVAPFVKQSAVGFETTIVAPATATRSDGRILVFAGWSDGGAASHPITIPDSDTTLVARYREDATPPDTYITAWPSAPNRDPTPTFYFEASEYPARFECRVDSAAWVACSSPWTAPYQRVGTHTVYVRAIDQANNVDGTPAERNFAVLGGSS